MDPAVASLGILALTTASAIIGQTIEDVETNIGSQSNPNSQVQLAPQMGNLHRFFNKAIAGEPFAYGTFCGVSGAITVAMLYLHLHAVIALAIGAAITTLIWLAYSTTAYLGRVSGQATFNQPVFLDMLTECLGPIAGHVFIVFFAITAVAYLMTLPVKGFAHPFPIPVIGMIWGMTIGAIGSAVGDVYYGAEVEFVHKKFGGGIPVASHGDITRKGVLGARSPMEVGNFTVKYGSPITGMAFGLIVLFTFWFDIVFEKWSILAAFLFVMLLIVINNRLEKHAREKYGPYRRE